MMDNIREKLVKMLLHVSEKCQKQGGVTWYDFADHLIANGVTVQEWIPVTERLPEKGEEVLVFDTRENWIGFAWLHHDETWTALGFDFPLDLGEVTHWMSLPALPKGE